MKSIYLILPISLILLLITTGSSDTVLDIDGNPVETQFRYYILPLYTRNTSELCPSDVILRYLDIAGGLPVRFKPLNPNDTILNESTDMNVEFTSASPCIKSRMWQRGRKEEVEEKDAYIIENKEGLYGESNWFKVEKGGEMGIYKMRYCPDICARCRVECGDIGVLNKFGTSFLGVGVRNTIEPLLVVFRRTRFP